MKNTKTSRDTQKPYFQGKLAWGFKKKRKIAFSILTFVKVQKTYRKIEGIIGSLILHYPEITTRKDGFIDQKTFKIL